MGKRKAITVTVPSPQPPVSSTEPQDALQTTGAIATVQDLTDALNRGIALPRRYTAEEIDDRRLAAYQLRMRGLTLTEIGDCLGISHTTVAKDIELAKQDASTAIDQFSPKGQAVEMLTAFDDIITEVWDVARNTRDPEVRLKALSEVRKTINDKQKAMQTAGFLQQQAPITNQVNLNVIGHWSEGNVQDAIKAILGMQLTSKPLEPVLDEDVTIEIAEIVEDFEEEEAPAPTIVVEDEEDENEYEDD